jgi:hypothetical protein
MVNAKAEQLYTVKRLGEAPDDPNERQAGETYGPMTKRAAQNLARRIYRENGDFAQIFLAGTETPVASVMWGGKLLVEFEYDEEGNKLPIDYETTFWADREALPEDN